MAGLLDGLNDFENSHAMQGLLSWTKSPEGSAMIQGLLQQASPSMTQPRSLNAGISKGMEMGAEARKSADEQAMEKQKFNLQQAILNQRIASGAADQKAYDAHQKMMQQLFGLQAPTGLLNDSMPLAPASPSMSMPSLSDMPMPLSGSNGDTTVSGNSGQLPGYDDLSNQTPARIPPPSLLPDDQSLIPGGAAPLALRSPTNTAQNNYVTLPNGLKVSANQFKKAQFLYSTGNEQEAIKTLLAEHEQNLTGVPQEYASLQALGDKYGVDSELYRNAKMDIDQRRDSTKQLMAYRQKLVDVADKRFSTPLGKTQSEIEDIKAGYLPSTGRTQEIESPEAQQTLLDTYNLAKQKQTTDVDTRRRSLFASNIDKTIARIDPDSLTQYGGIGGALAQKSQESLAAIGQQSPEYMQYSKSLQDAKLLAHQIRQFYGESIQPTMNEKIEKLINPADWRTNPELAKQNYNEIITLLHNETGTFRGGLRSVREFEDQGNTNTSGVNAVKNTNAPVNMSRENLEYTAKKYGMSVGDVIKKIQGGK